LNIDFAIKNERQDCGIGAMWRGYMWEEGR
jgi:hypothetical protein